jgi:hypothetical protein
LAYITGTRQSRAFNAIELNKEALKHEKGKQQFYPKWRLGFDVYNQMFSEGKMAMGGIETYKVVDPTIAGMLDKDQVINQIVPWIKYMSGVMTQATFTKLVPEYYTHQHVEQVKIWEDALWYFYRESHLYRDIYLANLLRFATGDGFIVVTWDANSKQDCDCYAKWERARENAIRDPNVTAESLELLEEDYNPEVHCLCTGALRTKVKSSLDIIPNQETMTDKDMIWYMDREKVELKRAREIFSQTGEGFLGGGKDLQIMDTTEIEGQSKDSSGMSPLTTFYADAEATCTVVERRWQRADHKKLPRGRLTITGMNCQVPLYDGPLPYNQVNNLNLFRFFYEPVPGYYWSNTNAYRAIPIQLNANEFMHKFKKVIHNHAMVKPGIDKDAGVTEDYDNDDANFFEFNGNNIQGRPPIHYVTPANPSRIYPETLAWYEKELGGVLNFFGLQTGQIPSELRSTPMLNTALEESNKQIRPIAENDIYTYDQMYQFFLKLAAENKPDQFFERFTGRNRGKYMYSLSDSFRDIPYKVHTEVRSVFDMSLMMKTQRLKELFAMGLIRPDEIEEFRKIIAESGGGFDNLEELNRPGEMNAYDENQRFLSEGVINDNQNLPYAFENHRAHFRIHSKQIETADFRELSRTNPQAVQVFFKHLDMTKGAIQEQEMEAAEMNQMRHEGVGTQPANKQGSEGVQFGEAGAPE